MPRRCPAKSVYSVTTNILCSGIAFDLSQNLQMRSIEEISRAVEVVYGRGGENLFLEAVQSLEVLGDLLSQLCGSGTKHFDDATIDSVNIAFCEFRYGGNPELATLDSIAKAHKATEECVSMIQRLYAVSIHRANRDQDLAIFTRLINTSFNRAMAVLPESFHPPYPANKDDIKEFLVGILRCVRKMRLDKAIASFPPFQEFFCNFQPSLALGIDYLRKLGVGSEAGMFERDLLSPF